MKKATALLLVANCLLCAVESESIKIDTGSASEREPTDEFVGALWASAGSSRRIENGVLRRREDGDFLDVGSLLQYDIRPGHHLGVEVSTDYAAEEAGQLVVEGYYLLQQRIEGLVVGELRLGAGYSQERHALADVNVLLGPIHLGYGREHNLDAYRLGLGACYVRKEFAVRLTFDRVMIYTDGAEEEPHLATEGALELAVNAGGYFVAYVGGGFVHDALGDLDGGESWQVQAGIAVRLW